MDKKTKSHLLSNVDLDTVTDYKTEIVELVKQITKDMLADNPSDAGCILAALYLASYSMYKAVETAILGVADGVDITTPRRKEDMN